MSHLPLVLRASTSFTPIAVVGLPAPVVTAGQVMAVDEDAWVWINQPEDGRTLLFHICASGDIDERPALPIVAAAAVQCGDRFVITGADGSGRPVVLGVDRDGDIRWRHVMDGPTPMRWPVPGCAPGPVVVSQFREGYVDVVDATPGALVQRTAIAVGGPPLATAVAGGSVWAVWSDALGVHAVEAGQAGIHTWHLDPAYASQVAVGSSSKGPCIAWGRADPPVLAVQGSGGSGFGRPVQLDVERLPGGMLHVVAGGLPLVHVRGAVSNDDGVLQPVSSLTGPHLEPLHIDGLVHSVACRDDVVFVLGSATLHVLKRVT